MLMTPRKFLVLLDYDTTGSGISQLLMADNKIKFDGDGSPDAAALAVAGAALLLLLVASGVGLLVMRRRRNLAMTRNKRVVILGGGFAGCQVAHDLEHECEVTIIDAGGGFTHVPDALKALAGFCTPEANHVPLAKLCPLCTVHIVTSMPKLAIAEKVVTISTTHGIIDVPYDFLVIATGSSYPSCDAIRCADNGSMVATDYHQISRQETAKISEASRVLVVGGGIVGMELVSEMAAGFPNVQVTLVAGRSGLLPECPPLGVRRARRWIAQKSNVRLIEGLRCSADAASTKIFTCETKVGHTSSGERIQCDLSYTCVGIVPNSGFLLGTELERHLSKKGFLYTDEHLRVLPDVWACGDVREKPPEQFLASFAHWEGEHVSEVIHAAATGGALPRPYRPAPRLAAVSLGPSDGFLAYDDWTVCWGRLVPVIKFMIKFMIMRFWLPTMRVMRWMPHLRQRSDVAASFQASSDCTRPNSALHEAQAKGTQGSATSGTLLF